MSRADLGAWVLKCDPRANPDVPRAARTGEAWVADRWCVVDNYRSRMMRAGDRVLLWVSGDGRLMPRGIWGVGRVTGPARDLPAEDARGRVRREVPLDLPLVRAWVSPEDVRAAGAADLEVLVQPHGSNPSWASRDQYAALHGLLRE